MEWVYIISIILIGGFAIGVFIKWLMSGEPINIREASYPPKPPKKDKGISEPVITLMQSIRDDEWNVEISSLPYGNYYYNEVYKHKSKDLTFHVRHIHGTSVYLYWTTDAENSAILNCIKETNELKIAQSKNRERQKFSDILLGDKK